MHLVGFIRKRNPSVYGQNIATRARASIRAIQILSPLARVNILANVYRGSFPGVKRKERGVDSAHPLHLASSLNKAQSYNLLPL